MHYIQHNWPTPQTPEELALAETPEMELWISETRAFPGWKYAPQVKELMTELVALPDARERLRQQVKLAKEAKVKISRNYETLIANAILDVKQAGEQIWYEAENTKPQPQTTIPPIPPIQPRPVTAGIPLKHNGVNQPTVATKADDQPPPTNRTDEEQLSHFIKTLGPNHFVTRKWQDRIRAKAREAEKNGPNE